MPHLLRLAAAPLPLLLTALAAIPATAAPPPKPRPKPPRPSIVGDWKLDCGDQGGRILFRKDGTYRLIWCRGSEYLGDWGGDWKLQGDRLTLEDYRDDDRQAPAVRYEIDLTTGRLESRDAVHCWGPRWRLTPWRQ